jgi:hypothetical protein
MKSKVRVNAMRDAVALSKDQERMQARMRRKHGPGRLEKNLVRLDTAALPVAA